MSARVAALAVFVASSLALAQSLKPFQKEAKAAFETSIADGLKAMNDACGTKATVKADFENFKAAEWEGQSVYSRCEAVLSGIQRLCDKPAYKEEITKGLKTVACLFGGKYDDKSKVGYNEQCQQNMSYKGGTFTFKAHKDLSNITDNAEAVMKKALDE